MIQFNAAVRPSEPELDDEGAYRLEQMAVELLHDLPVPHPAAAVVLARQVARAVIRLENLDALSDAAVEDCPRTLFQQLERIGRLRDAEARVLQRVSVALDVVKSGLAGGRTIAVVPREAARKRRRRA